MISERRRTQGDLISGWENFTKDRKDETELGVSVRKQVGTRDISSEHWKKFPHQTTAARRLTTCQESKYRALDRGKHHRPWIYHRIIVSLNIRLGVRRKWARRKEDSILQVREIFQDITQVKEGTGILRTKHRLAEVTHLC